MDKVSMKHLYDIHMDRSYLIEMMTEKDVPPVNFLTRFLKDASQEWIDFKHPKTNMTALHVLCMNPDRNVDDHVLKVIDILYHATSLDLRQHVYSRDNETPMMSYLHFGCFPGRANVKSVVSTYLKYNNDFPIMQKKRIPNLCHFSIMLMFVCRDCFVLPQQLTSYLWTMDNKVKSYPQEQDCDKPIHQFNDETVMDLLPWIGMHCLNTRFITFDDLPEPPSVDELINRGWIDGEDHLAYMGHRASDDPFEPG
eukprot:TRINITY_DN1223_c0_g1_i3.p1 TRINITY_DN1223_c0_g1~~TRINITY_DN1223_c0_g1_i3.p1  ORF type:complete len:253 (-),score=36.37 TRINITY_DN1223_c0_g1_i3:508-1266(-)